MRKSTYSLEESFNKNKIYSQNLREKKELLIYRVIFRCYHRFHLHAASILPFQFLNRSNDDKLEKAQRCKLNSIHQQYLLMILGFILLYS